MADFSFTPEVILGENSSASLFSFGDERRVTDGLQYWVAYCGRDIHMWQTDDRKRKLLLSLDNLPYDHPVRKTDIGKPTINDQELKYAGPVTKGEALAGVLIWLAKHTDQDGNPLPRPIEPEGSEFDVPTETPIEEVLENLALGLSRTHEQRAENHWERC